MNTLRILGLDDDNHAPCFRCEDGTTFDRPQELIEFLAKPHDCQVEVRMFAIIDDLSEDLAKYDMDKVDDMFYYLEGHAIMPEGMTHEQIFNLFWESHNRMHWYW